MRNKFNLLREVHWTRDWKYSHVTHVHFHSSLATHFVYSLPSSLSFLSFFCSPLLTVFLYEICHAWLSFSNLAYLTPLSDMIQDLHCWVLTGVMTHSGSVPAGKQIFLSCRERQVCACWAVFEYRWPGYHLWEQVGLHLPKEMVVGLALGLAMDYHTVSAVVQSVLTFDLTSSLVGSSLNCYSNESSQNGLFSGEVLLVPLYCCERPDPLWLLSCYPDLNVTRIVPWINAILWSQSAWLREKISKLWVLS
jgi:hypothetical protein